MPTIHQYTEAAGWHANEDAVHVYRHPGNPELVVCALADGQGGQAGGASAAGIAVSSSLKAASSTEPELLLLPSTWEELCHTADCCVATSQYAGYTTLVALAVFGEWVAGASTGDSLALLLLDDAIVDLTAHQRKHPPVGSGEAIFESFSAMLNGHWRLLLMSDGAWKPISWDRLVEICQTSPGAEIASILRQEIAVQTGGNLPDDFSVVVVES